MSDRVYEERRQAARFASSAIGAYEHGATCDVCDDTGEMFVGCPPDCPDADREYPCDFPHRATCPNPWCHAVPLTAVVVHR